MIRLSSITRLVVGVAALVPVCLQAQGVGPHLGVGLLSGEAAGLNDGYISFSGMVPLATPDERSLLFAEGSLLLFNEGTEQIGGNVTLGYRTLCDQTGTILGGHFHYDRRDLGLVEFDQVGVGLESLGEHFDTRLSVNVPTGDTDRGTLAFSTIDGELAALVSENDWSQLRAVAGVYGLFHDTTENTAGVRGRVELRIVDQCFVGGYIEHDDLFDTTAGFTLEYRFGRTDRSRRSLLARLGDPIQRRRHIVVAEADTISATTTSLVDSEPETEPPTGGPGLTPGGTTDPPEPEVPVTPGGTTDPSGEPTGGGREPYRPPPREDTIEPGGTPDPAGGERSAYRPPPREEFAPLVIPAAVGGRS